MGFAQAPDTPVYEDNAACIEWGNHVIGGRAKHIDIRKHFAHEAIQNRQMRLVKVETSSQLADIFTKPLQLQQFIACCDGLLTGQRGQALPRRGPCDSGGGKKSPYCRRCEDGCCGHWNPRDRATLALRRGVCKDSTRPEWTRSVVRVRRPVESDPRLRGLGPMSDGPVENQWDSEKSRTALWRALIHRGRTRD